MTREHDRAVGVTARPAVWRAWAGPAGLLGRLAGMLALGRSRARLESLDNHMLRDIGLTREEALREAARPPWDPPDWWR